MTEDEAFIRAIVDSPGDDTPRLAYADWLDERDDPRGPYLRAEREAVVSGDIARLRQLAVGLDPVWVARVSLPPVGVCVKHTELTERGPSISEADIAEVEHRIGSTFPADYRAFLLNYNGGWIGSYMEFETPGGQIIRKDEPGWRLNPADRVHRFVLRPGDVLPNDPPEHWGMPQLTEPLEDWVSRFVVIGHDPDYIGGVFLGVATPDFGQVRLLDTSVELEAGVRGNALRPPFATTFAEFLSYLPGYPPPHTQRGGEAAIPF